MELHNLPKGSTRPSKRLGRGLGSNWGKTAGRGQKGAKSRSGYSVRPGFEGGQMPLYRKLPQRGFSNYRFRTDYEIVNIGDLQSLDINGVITRKVLIDAGLAGKNSKPLKILGNGELSKKIEIKAEKFSSSAVSKIEAAGGKAITVVSNSEAIDSENSNKQ